jgi:hypothetical protein
MANGTTIQPQDKRASTALAGQTRCCGWRQSDYRARCARHKTARNDHPFFMKIICGTDFSQHAVEAADVAARLAVRLHEPVALVHVFETALSELLS